MLKKKFFIIHLREKHVKQKIISMCSQSHPKFVSRLFLKNKENKLHRKYTLLGGPAVKNLVHQDSSTNKNIVHTRNPEEEYSSASGCQQCRHMNATVLLIHLQA